MITTDIIALMMPNNIDDTKITSFALMNDEYTQIIAHKTIHKNGSFLFRCQFVKKLEVIKKHDLCQNWHDHTFQIVFCSVNVK